MFRQTVTLDEVLAAPTVFDPLTRLQCCPPTCGAAAAVVCSEDFAKKHGLDRRVRIAAQAMTTDTASTFGSHDMRRLVGYDMAVAASKKVYEAAGIGPEDVDVVELHDCFTDRKSTCRSSRPRGPHRQHLVARMTARSMPISCEFPLASSC